ncbi:MAG: SPOR domain-containing protein [Plesiomonas sp.]|uniref:SPOR domain-containing protein n=1 Tax=Plesiomonas sp. TaxID=2486279 RepID=UPI003F414AE6
MVWCLLFGGVLSGCAPSAMSFRTDEACTPRLSLHLLYEAQNPDAIAFRNSEDERFYLSAPLLQCQHIDDVFYIYSMDGSGPTIRLDLSAQGQAILSTQTREHVRGNLAVLIDGQLLSMPIIQMPIDGSSLLIDGIADEVVAKSLVHSIRAQSNIGRYQQAISTVPPVIFQAGMPLFPVEKSTLVPTLPQPDASLSSQVEIATPLATVTPTTDTPETDMLDATNAAQPLSSHPPAFVPTVLIPTPSAGLSEPDISAVRQKLRSMPASAYTIQLIATPNYPLAKAVEQERNIPSAGTPMPRYLYKTLRHKQAWYLVVLGEYGSLQEARTAAQQHVTPYYTDAWIKSVRKVHQELAEPESAI